jgi:hypothetical protein
MFEYDKSLEEPVGGWIQRIVGALLAVAVQGGCEHEREREHPALSN